MKLFLSLQYLLISNEYISLVILILVSIVITSSCYYEQTYNNNHLEIALNMRNLLILWTYFVLFISKIFENYVTDGFIFLLVIGYPFMLFLSFLIFKEKDINKIDFSENISNINIYMTKIKFYIKLINSFIERNQNIRYGNENESLRNLVFL
jgi:hypothetical protein